MKTYDNNSKAVTIDAREFLGNYLKKEDLSGPTDVTVIDVRPEPVPGANRLKLVIEFREFEKPLILNATNIKRLSTLFGTSNIAAWRGPISLYVDEKVEYAGAMIGGIRVRPAKEAVQNVSHAANGVTPGNFA